MAVTTVSCRPFASLPEICVCSPWAGYICMYLPWVPLQHSSCKEVYLRLTEPSHSSAFVTVQNNKHNKQYTYNVTMRHIHATTVAVENNKYYIFQKCDCNLRYPACQAHVPYCHLWPDRLYSIFTHLINGKIFEKGVTEYQMCILISSTTFVWNISYSNEKWARYDKKCKLIFR